MAIRDQFRANAQHLLQPDEQVQQVFGAQTMTGWLSALSPLLMLILNGYRVVVVTDRRILVCTSGRFRQTPVKGIAAELPRNTLIGPAHGLWYKTEALGPKALYVHKRFHKDVAAADALVDPTAG